MTYLATPRRLALVAAFALAVTACTSDAQPASAPEPTTTAAPQASDLPGAQVRKLVGLGPLSVRDGRIVDSEGRQVLLRGTATNSLGDYYQGNPELPVVPDLDASDWDLMAAHGFSAIRLVVSWSFVEPSPGRYDDQYIAQVAEAVDAAAARGMYTIIDFHQDAWGKHIASPSGTTCPQGTEPAIGWDGAPQWATITDGASTCRGIGMREQADAVRHAFNNFWHDTNGIQSRFVDMWAHLVTELGDRPGIVGWDLLNEPNRTLSGADMVTAYTGFVQRTIRSIRSAEAALGRSPGILFLEPLISYPLPDSLPDFEALDERNVVFSPHIYPNILTRKQFLDVDHLTSDEWGVPLWIGEFSFPDISEAGLADVAGFLDQLDERVTNWSWWLWQTACGDPHYVGVPRTAAGDVGPTTSYYHLMTANCPSGTDEPTNAFLKLAGRGYPRVAPGRVTKLVSDPVAGTLRIDGDDAEVGQELVVWLPPASGTQPDTEGSTGLTSIRVTPVEGGALLRATVDAATYRLELTPGD